MDNLISSQSDAPATVVEGDCNSNDNAEYDNGNSDFNNDDEEDLRAALQLSMCPDEEKEGTAKRQNNNVLNATSMNPIMKKSLYDEKDETKSKSNFDVQERDCPTPHQGHISRAFDCVSFHKLMWDDARSTVNDKQRWMNEKISTASMQNEQQVTLHFASAIEKDGNLDKDEEFQCTLSPLERFTGTKMDNDEKSGNGSITDAMPNHSHQHWGLTQEHGGPCGVLAAVQAEMIRLLLFGKKSSKKSSSNKLGYSNENRDGSLYYPFSPSEFCGIENSSEEIGNFVSAKTQEYKEKNVTPSEANEAMAMAIGMILARASVTPTAIEETSLMEQKNNLSPCVCVVLPVGDNGVTNSDYHAGMTAAETETGCSKVHSVGKWADEMLYSSLENAGNLLGSVAKQSGLKVHTITALDKTLTKDNGCRDGCAVDDTSPESKRQKKKEVSFLLDSDANQKKYTSSSNVMDLAMQEKITRLAHAVSVFLLGQQAIQAGPLGTHSDAVHHKKPLDFFNRPGGVMFLVMSLVESRGIERIQKDMDDPHTTMTSQFGHSSQELINLLLTGQAVSNVFDNTMTISGTLTCRGVQFRPAIGYLSQLEALHYCEVGRYYKSPLFPIWVIGSTSHFSVLFGDERCLKESKSDLILERCRQAFKAVEGGSENGFILADKLGQAIDELDLTGKLGGDNGVHTLQAYLEVNGAEIILWDDFWKACSRLMMGSSLESIVQADEHNGPPLLITQFGECRPNDPKNASSTMESDEELAKKLAAEWGTSGQMDDEQNTKSDEDFARELQKQWDAEISGLASSTGNDDLLSQMASAEAVEHLPPTERMDAENFDQLSGEPTPENDKMDFDMVLFEDSACPGVDKKDNSFANHPCGEVPPVIDEKVVASDPGVRSKQKTYDFEKFGVSFPLYHYNGLRGGCLTPFSVTRLRPEEAVGASIALTSRSAASAQQNSGRGGDGDLEDVVRTKWPSCTFNWLGKNPPYID